MTVLRPGPLPTTRTPAVQLLALVLALVGAWATSSPALREAAGEHAGREHRRTGVREAVRRLTAPPTA